MTLNEVKELVAKEDESRQLFELELEVNFTHINIEQSLKGAIAIFEFIARQANGWNNINQELPAELNNSKTLFNNSLTNFVTLLKTNDPYFRNWSEMKRDLENANRKIFTFDCPETTFLIELWNNNQAYYDGAYKFIINNISSNVQDKNVFIGRNLAYEFYMKDQTGITKRRDAEKLSLGQLKNDFSRILTESQRHIKDYIQKTDHAYAKYATRIDEMKKSKEEEFDNWFSSSRLTFEEFDTGSLAKIKDLEKTYAELLRLKMPAEYWRNRAIVLKKEGNGFMKWIITLVLLGCIALYLLLWLTPDGMLLSFTKNQASAIKWSIIYITFISLFAFGIRALAKVMFSSFHLARDAEEREQLAYLYLSLIKESAVDDKDRNMVLQALFSRAETGLLKDESGPTMPSGILDKVLSK